MVVDPDADERVPLRQVWNIRAMAEESRLRKVTR